MDWSRPSTIETKVEISTYCCNWSSIRSWQRVFAIPDCLKHSLKFAARLLRRSLRLKNETIFKTKTQFQFKLTVQPQIFNHLLHLGKFSKHLFDSVVSPPVSSNVFDEKTVAVTHSDNERVIKDVSDENNFVSLFVEVETRSILMFHCSRHPIESSLIGGVTLLGTKRVFFGNFGN